MHELEAFHERFVSALCDGTRLTARDRDAMTCGVRVYQNTVYKAWVDALRDNFPTVLRLVGDESFAASAREFLTAYPCESACLAAFGAEYPQFLSGLTAAADFPYLPGVARLDRFWIESCFAEDARAAASAELAGFPLDRLFDLRLPLHPAARIGWFDEPAPMIWQMNRPPAPLADNVDFDWTAQGALITRPHHRIDMTILDLADFVFLAKCRDGATLGEAAMAMFDIEPKADLAPRMACFLGAGAFAPPCSTPQQRD